MGTRGVQVRERKLSTGEAESAAGARDEPYSHLAFCSYITGHGMLSMLSHCRPSKLRHYASKARN